MPLFIRTQAHPRVEDEYHGQADDSSAGSSGIAGESLLARETFYVDHLTSMRKEVEAGGLALASARPGASHLE
jgi:hypothetical protein